MGLILALNGAACLPGAQRDRPAEFIPRGIDVNREFARRLVNFYAPIPETELESLRAHIAGICDFRLAAKGSHYGAPLYYQGPFSPREARGVFCKWNGREELIEFGEYDASGKLTGRHATFYKDQLRSLRTRPITTQGLIVQRAWDWVLNNRQWKVTLALLKLEGLRRGRTVEYIFERESGYLVKRREYIERGEEKIHRGIHYNGYPSKEYPQCVEFLDSGQRRTITEKCSFSDRIEPGSNRFVPAGS